MGDPKQSRKRFKGPGHPWERWRIEAERIVKREYGLKNKKEIWKADSLVRRFNAQAKRLIRQRSKQNPQVVKEEKQLLDRLFKLGLVNEGAILEDVLAIELKNVLDRRLQTFVFKSGMALTAKQARQFIVHGNIFLNGKKVSVPSYALNREEQFKITFNPNSSLTSDEHPERAKKIKMDKPVEIKKVVVEVKEVKESKKLPDEMSEEEIKKLEKEVGEVIVE